MIRNRPVVACGSIYDHPSFIIVTKKVCVFQRGDEQTRGLDFKAATRYLSYDPLKMCRVATANSAQRRNPSRYASSDDGMQFSYIDCIDVEFERLKQ